MGKAIRERRTGMAHVMRMLQHRSVTGSMSAPLLPIGSSLSTMALGPVFINIIDYLLLFLILMETVAGYGPRQDCGDPRASMRIGRSERRVVLA